ncbi:hypothetical protein ScPMuIL_007994 [Solemya velum]
MRLGQLWFTLITWFVACIGEMAAHVKLCILVSDGLQQTVTISMAVKRNVTDGFVVGRYDRGELHSLLTTGK